MVDGTVYLMFLNGHRHQPDNKYVGVTTLGLSKRLKRHVKSQTIKAQRDIKLYRIMRERGVRNWVMEPLAELWLCTKEDLRALEKYYIRLFKPDLNTQNGSASDERCEYYRECSSQPWTCPTCLTVSQFGSKWQHHQTQYHRAINNLMTELD